jgi:hypothetical protein
MIQVLRIHSGLCNNNWHSHFFLLAALFLFSEMTLSYAPIVDEKWCNSSGLPWDIVACFGASFSCLSTRNFIDEPSLSTVVPLTSQCIGG